MKEIAQALMQARREMTTIAHDEKAVVKGERGSYDYTYASLKSIVETVTPILLNHGVIIVQEPFAHDDRAGVITKLIHAPSGEYVSSELSLKLSKNDAQGAGSALTYARRYALSALLNLATEADDDGKLATTVPEKAVRQPRVKQETFEEAQPNGQAPYSETERKADYKKLFAALKAYRLLDEAEADKLADDKQREGTLMNLFNVMSLNQLGREQIQGLIKTVNKRIDRAVLNP